MRMAPLRTKLSVVAVCIVGVVTPGQYTLQPALMDTLYSQCS